MAKLIFTSRYLKDAKPSQKENYVHYIGTRKGVEKIDTSKKHLPATVSQKKLVHQLLQDFPATKENQQSKMPRNLFPVYWNKILI